MNKKPIKRYIVEKIVDATSLSDAIKKEREFEVNRISELQPQRVDTHAIGFHIDNPEEYED